MKKLIVLVAALCMLATSAYAADWNFYGQARVATQYTKVENQTGTVENTNLAEWLLTTSRIGANVKASDSLAGRFEYGAGGGNASIRLLYGEWNFGGGKLLVGQDYSPLLNIQSNSVYSFSTAVDELDMLFTGYTYGGRVPQLKLTFGDFKIAAITPNAGLDPASSAVASNYTKVMLPKFEASYRLAQNNWWVLFGAGYQTFDIYAGANQTGNDVSVNSYIGALTAGLTLGPVTLSAGVYGGQNAGAFANIGADNNAASPTFMAGGRAKYVAATNTVIDNDVIGYTLVGTYKASDMFTFEAGVGSVKTELDQTGSTKDDVIQYYIQSVITLAPGVSVIPEIGVVDFRQNAQTDNTYLAAKWQINF